MPPVAHPLDPNFEAALVLHRAGNFAAAAERYQAMLAVDPNYAKAWHTLGLVHSQTGNPIAALQFIQRAIELRSDNPVYHSNRAMILRGLARNLEAAQSFERALELDPTFVDARLAFASSLTAICRADLAVPHYEQVLAATPNSAEAHASYAHTLGELCDAEGARREYQQADRISPTLASRLLAATQLPPVYRSHDDLQFWRTRLESEVDALVAAGETIDLAQYSAMPVFSLAHQGCNDVAINRNIARLYRGMSVNVVRQRPEGAAGKIHVGFVSSHFRDHTIGKLMRGFIEHLDRREFFVTVFSIGFHDDETAQKIRAGCDHYVPLGTDHRTAAPPIAAADCDLLLYTDIGMDPTTYSMAFTRLAPVQCVSWGHPDTTGIDTIDYFVSSELFESPGPMPITAKS